MSIDHFAITASKYEFNALAMHKWLFNFNHSKITISVVQGPYSYGGSAGFYEYWIFNNDGPKINEPIGYMTKQEIDNILIKCYQNAWDVQYMNDVKPNDMTKGMYIKIEKSI